MANPWSTTVAYPSANTPNNFFDFGHQPVPHIFQSPARPAQQIPVTQPKSLNTDTPLKTPIKLVSVQSETGRVTPPPSNPYLNELQQFKFANENKDTANAYSPLVARKSTRTLGGVRPENSPTIKPRHQSERRIAQNYDELLNQITPSQNTKETNMTKKEPDLNVKPKRPSLVPPMSLFKGIKRKSRVSFREEAEVVEVESWKIFNVDMAKKLRVEASKNRQDLCILF